MQVHEQRIGYKPVLPQPFDFSYHVRLLEKPLMHTDVTRLEIWEWSDYTRRRRRGQHNTRQACTQELEQKADTEQHRCRKADLPAIHGGQPVENL